MENSRKESLYVRSLIEASLDPLVTINAEGKITDVNEASVKVTGVERKNLIGTDFSNYFTHPDNARVGYLKVFEKGFVSDYPLTIKHINGKLTDVLYNASLYKDENGKVLGVFAAARDVTEQKWAIDLRIANKELAFQNNEKEKRAAELIVANKELLFQNAEKEKRAEELAVANTELAYQNTEKENRAAELIIANKELQFQNNEKEKRAAELIIANKELIFQNGEKESRAQELVVANKELAYQNITKEKKAEELVIANKELDFQTAEKKRKEIENKALEKSSYALKIASQYSLSLIEASLDPLVTINAEGIITDLNEATVTITGVDRKKLVGSYFFNYFTEPLKAKQVYEEIFEYGSVIDSPLTLRHVDGKLTDVLFNGSVYRDDANNVVGVVIVARDVTQKKIADAQLDKNLREISAYKRALDESSIVAITDKKGLIRYANNNFCKISKYTREELIGKDHRILNSGFHPKEFMQNLWKTIETGTVWRGEIKNKAKDGSFYWVDTTIVPFTNEEGKIYQYIAIRSDITAKKVLSQYTLSLIEASRDPLVTISPGGKIMDMNQAMVSVTGVSRDKLKGSDFKIYFTDPEKASKVYQEVFKKGFVADYPLTIKDHKLTDVLFNGSIYKDDQGNVMGAVIVARDITEQKRTERELLEAIAFAELATGIAENAKMEADTAAQTARDSVKAKQQFLSNMSHEIRTPMNAIIGFTKVILKTELTPKQLEYLMAIKMSGDALIVLINDILDLAKVDAGKMVFEKSPFRLAVSLSAMLHLFEPKIQEKNLSLIKEYDNRIPEILLGDSVRLHQIILNLVSNAVKFTSSGSITVSAKMIHEEDEKVKIEFAVTDTGIGINKEKIEKIFENFQQASSGTSRIYGGTGLGLAIVKQLVEQQGGEVEVVSKINEGSTFSFTMDFNKTTSESLDEPELILRDEKLSNVKVLVVEDIVLNQLLMKTLLDDFGFERDIAANGQLAIEKLQKKNYDIILMDLQMPIMNGFETTAYIRNTLKLTIPIVALTADVTTVDLAKCKAVGMNDYIAKPVDERALYSKIVSLVKKRSGGSKEELIKNSDSDSEIKYTNLQYLMLRTKSDPALMMEMISLYLEQTPALINSMKESHFSGDWINLKAAAHKMIPSFSIMGIDPQFENMAKKIQEYAQTQEQSEQIDEMVQKLENVCRQACVELKEEYNTIKKNRL